MENGYPLSTPMVVQLLEPYKDPFHPKKLDKEILPPKVSYLNAIGVLIYLAQCTTSNIAFAINLLA